MQNILLSEKNEMEIVSMVHHCLVKRGQKCSETFAVVHKIFWNGHKVTGTLVGGPGELGDPRVKTPFLNFEPSECLTYFN